MTGFVDSTVNEIDVRLQELRTEMAQLEAARSVLVSSAGGRRPSLHGRDASPRRRRVAPQVRTSQRRGSNARASEALALVRSRPGITIPQIATAMGTRPNYLYRVLPRLEEERKVRRDGQEWHPAA